MLRSHRTIIGLSVLLPVVLLTGCSRAESKTLNVPFVAQSPYEVWDAVHEDACEEMSLIMVQHYLNNEPLTQSGAEVELQKMIAWEGENGYGIDISVSQIGEIAQKYSGDSYRVMDNVTADSIKAEVAAGNPVIIPASGRALDNPHFVGGAAFYHVLVVIGYTPDGFVTNEPGTQDGAKYFYKTDAFMAALHDWNGSRDNIESGPKKALVIEK